MASDGGYSSPESIEFKSEWDGELHRSLQGLKQRGFLGRISYSIVGVVLWITRRGPKDNLDNWAW